MIKKYVLVGTGARGTAGYIRPLTEELSDCAYLAAVCDLNEKRAHAALKYAGNTTARVYTDFMLMLETEKPDTVIVTTKDCTHDEYIIKAMEFGCDVLSEKPLTTDEVKFKAIYDCMKRTGKKVTTTFNCRFFPFYVKIKELLSDGAIGDILSVNYEWLLDTSHGADYFRRWHRERKNSGSLLIHKATHHFDLLNWFLAQDPVKVNAFGTRRFYGNTREERSERCLTCPHKISCEFYYDITKRPFDVAIYKDVEDADGYLRDRCVFSDEIDIEDSVCLNIKYSGGTVVSYTFTAHSPYEGPRFVFNGTKGRLEASAVYSVTEGKVKNEIKIYDRFTDVITYDFDTRGLAAKTNAGFGTSRDILYGGGHGGSDHIMRQMLIRGGYEDALGQVADIKAAAMSIGIGIAANKSMAEDRAVSISELFDI